MPTPEVKKLITLKVTNAGASDYATIHNITQGWKVRTKFNSSSESIYNPAKDGNTVEDEDKIIAYVNGRMIGSDTGTISLGGVLIKFTGTVDVKSLAVNL